MPREHPRELTKSTVERKINALQQALLDADNVVPGRDRSWAVANLAQLRHNSPNSPNPTTWAILFADVPEELLGDGRLSRAEATIVAALTLYATHQQSRSAPMHRRGLSPGAAIRRLAMTSDGQLNPAVVKRFQTAGTSSEFDEATYHWRQLVTQLRQHDVPMDHATLAADLFDFHTSKGQERARLRWGRDLYRPSRKETQANSEEKTS